jgi:hypothetical protein
MEKVVSKGEVQVGIARARMADSTSRVDNLGAIGWRKPTSITLVATFAIVGMAGDCAAQSRSGLQSAAALPILKTVASTKSETDYIRCDALTAIAMIDHQEGLQFANQIAQDDPKCLGDLAAGLTRWGSIVEENLQILAEPCMVRPMPSASIASTH